jgi:hypothetical protein
MTLERNIAKTRNAAFKAAATYATAKKGVDLAKKAADQIAHVWEIEDTYAESLYRAALKVATDHQVPMPGARQKVTTGRSYMDNEQFSSSQWRPLKGIAPGVQVRKSGSDRIEFRAFRLKDMNALRARVETVAETLQEEEVDIDFTFEPFSCTQIFTWDGKGEWSFTKERPSRSFNSVVVPEALQQEIEADLKRFSDSRDRLVRLEMPWRRGYLLSGPPGTGKTSLSLAIAGALGFSLATLSLTDIKSDGMLRKAVSTLRGRSVLVIEDIDANAVSHERDHNTGQDGALSLSGLLNALDGFETPEGLVTILTTNHIEKLDAALVRSGRMDRTFHLDQIEAREVERLFEWFYEQPAPEPAPEHTGAVGISPADVTELFKQHLDDAQGGWQAVMDRIDTNALHIAA